MDMKTIKVSGELCEAVDSYGLIANCVEGKLICGDVGSFAKLMRSEELAGKIRPVIISETEKILLGDSYLDDTLTIRISVTDDEDYWSRREDYNKILVLPEQFTKEQVRAIADGKMKYDDMVLVEIRKMHQHKGQSFGVDISRTGITQTMYETGKTWNEVKQPLTFL